MKQRYCSTSSPRRFLRPIPLLSRACCRTPLLIQEGWLRHQEKDAKPPRRRRRGGRDCLKCFGMRSLEEVRFSTTPSAPLKEASRLLLDVASTPPVSGGELPASDSFRQHALSRRGGCAINKKTPFLSGAD